MEIDHICQVCFTNSQPPRPNNPLLSCRSCSVTAHRYCYFPQNQDNTFICDACRHAFKGKCNWCHSGGLLKKIGQNYGHPVCLLFNSGAIISKFSDLSFCQVESQRFRKLKCDYCQITTGSVLRCCMNCQRQTHIYCALKNGHPEEGKGWRVCLQPLDGFRNYQEPYQNLLLRCIRGSNHFLANQLNVRKSVKTIEVGVMLYCEDHSATIVECTCREFDETKLQWLYCDSCCRWQHLDCIKASESTKSELKQSKDLFICHECQQWRLWLKEPTPQLPNQLPKLQIYDYIFLNTLVQIKGQDTPPAWVDFLKTIPLMPGMAYAQLFFKKQIAKRVKNKIDLPFLKSKVEQLQDDRDRLGSFMLKNRSRLELVWLLIEGSIFGGDGKHFAYILEDEQLDPLFIDQMLDLLHKYQVKYCWGKSQVFATAKKALELRPRQRGNEQKSRMKQKFKSPFVESEGSHTKIKVQQGSQCQKSIIEKEKRQQLIKVIADAFDSAMTNIQNINSEDESFIKLFEQLHSIIRTQGAKDIIQEMPMNLFTRSIMLFKNASDSATFMSYIAHINYLQQEWQRLKANNQECISVLDIDRIEQLSDMGSYLKECIYSIDNDLLRSQLVKQVLERESQGNFPTISVYQYRYGYPREDWTTIPAELMSIKQLACILKVKELNNERPPKLYLAFTILQKLKKVKFTPSTKKQLTIRAHQLKSQHQSYIQIIEVLQQFHLLYDQTSKLLTTLKAKVKPNKCLIENISEVKVRQLVSNKQHRESLVDYLTKLQLIKFSIYSSSIQKRIKDMVSTFLQCFEEGKIEITTEKQLKVARNWLHRLTLKMPQVQALIDLDKELCSRFVCIEPNFEKQSSVDSLQEELKQVLIKFGSTMFVFRNSKIKLILQWIKAYRLIKNRLPLQCLFSQEICRQLQVKDKPSVIMMTRFSALLDKMHFPQGSFKARLKDIISQSQKLKQQYECLMAPCDWGFAYGQSQPNWNKKIPIEHFQQFIKKAKLLPLCMQVQILECEIITQKFKDNENMAGLLLAEAARLPPQVPNKEQLQRAREILTHFGSSPIRSQRINKLLQLTATLQQPQKIQMQAQRLFYKITKSVELVDYKQVRSLIRVIQGSSLASKLNLTLLRELIAPLQECMELYHNQIAKFTQEQAVFNAVELKKLESFRLKVQSTHIFEDTLSEIVLQISLHQFLLVKNHKILAHERNKSCHKIDPKQVQTLLNTCLILHPSFLNEDLKQLKAKLKQIIKNQNAIGSTV